jgi:hypothetical protein
VSDCAAWLCAANVLAEILKNAKGWIIFSLNYVILFCTFISLSMSLAGFLA